MIILRSIRLELGEDLSSLKAKAAKKLRIPEGDIVEIFPVKRSLDARKKNDIHYNCSAAMSLKRGEEKLLKRGIKELAAYEKPEYVVKKLQSDKRPVVVGFGPAGMFASLVLARAGLKPIVLERGQDALSRKAAVEAFRNGGSLDTENNVQFGEGGAGTFSDGKLNTGTHDKRMGFVLKEFAAHGASDSVVYDAKPHIGTDVLIDVVQNIRREVIELGGEVRFGAKLVGLESENGALCAARYVQNGVEQLLPCERLILAIGHSARDSFEFIRDMGINMERKPFSMGARIEHKQAAVDLAQYGRERGEELPPADYSLNVHLPDGTSAYTFCMCPGGEVFAAASEEGAVVTNGMSYSKRDGENANAALLVTLHTEDFPGDDVLAGMYWQREIERRAYEYSGSYKAPAQLVGDFLAGRESTAPGTVTPSYMPGVHWGSIEQVLPPRITRVMKNAIPELGKKLRGFDAHDAVLTAPETRSSSPVRIIRDKSLQSSLQGLYPCGEGAGYAGGITSAAVDGLRCAEAVIDAME